ncbi:putative FMN-binding domain-containing protein [Trametes maxima]|nr:putative FMN-binding domain-containing protein [Trametes maxima]
MYLRAVHVETHLPLLRELIRSNPLGILTTAIPSPNFPLLQSSHIPFVLSDPDSTSPVSSRQNEGSTVNSSSSLGTLRGHLARANPQSRALIEHLASAPALPGSDAKILEQEVLVLFTSHAHHYVTPKFYTQTKPDTGKVVPTWDYAAVQVYGKLKVYFDSRSEETGAFLQRQVEELTEASERGIMGYEQPWQVSDAPESYIGLLKKAIVGVEVLIDRMEGKWKMSQESTEGDAQGVIDGFAALEDPVAQEVSRCVQERRKLAEERKASETKVAAKP